MYETAERLKQFASPTPSRWRENAEARLANQETRRKARKIAMNMLNAMESKGINEVALSTLLGVSCSELMPILKGHELPTACMAQAIETALNISL